jgi:hypothetical protein
MPIAIRMHMTPSRRFDALRHATARSPNHYAPFGKRSFSHADRLKGREAFNRRSRQRKGERQFGAGGGDRGRTCPEPKSLECCAHVMFSENEKRRTHTLSVFAPSTRESTIPSPRLIEFFSASARLGDIMERLPARQAPHPQQTYESTAEQENMRHCDKLKHSRCTTKVFGIFTTPASTTSDALSFAPDLCSNASA